MCRFLCCIGEPLFGVSWHRELERACSIEGVNWEMGSIKLGPLRGEGMLGLRGLQTCECGGKPGMGDGQGLGEPKIYGGFAFLWKHRIYVNQCFSMPAMLSLICIETVDSVLSKMDLRIYENL